MYFDLDQRSAFAIKPDMAHLTKVKPDPNDPAPDLTMQVARDIAKREHPRKDWQDYSMMEQTHYKNSAAFIILNVIRWEKEFGYVTKPKLIDFDKCLRSEY